MHEVNMTGTQYRRRLGHTNFARAPSAAGFLSGATFVAVLAMIASLLPGIVAAQAQVRLELATVDGPNGSVYHKWSDNNGVSWSPWSYLGFSHYGRAQGTPAMASDGAGRLHIMVKSVEGGYGGLFQRTYLTSIGDWGDWFLIPGQDGTGTICVESQCFTLGSS